MKFNSFICQKHFKNLGDEALWKSRVLRNHDSAFPLSCPTPKNHNQKLTQKSVIFFFFIPKQAVIEERSVLLGSQVCCHYVCLYKLFSAPERHNSDVFTKFW